LAKVGLPHFQRSKIGPKTIEATFICDAHNSVAYGFIFKDDSDFGANKEFGDAEFFRHIFSYENFCE